MRELNSRMPIVIAAIVLLTVIMACVLYMQFLHKGPENMDPSSNTTNIVGNEIVGGENNTVEDGQDPEDNETDLPFHDDSESDKPSESTPEIEAKDENSEEQKKAIEMVKKDWGANDSNVYYQADEPKGKKGNEHTINVIDKNTTKVKRIYEVNIATGEIEKDDIY